MSPPEVEPQEADLPSGYRLERLTNRGTDNPVVRFRAVAPRAEHSRLFAHQHLAEKACWTHLLYGTWSRTELENPDAAKQSPWSS